MVGSTAVVDTLGKRKNLLPLLGFEPGTSCSLVTISTTVSLLPQELKYTVKINKIIMDHIVSCMKHEGCKKIVSKLLAQVPGFIHNAYSLFKIFSLQNYMEYNV